MRSATMYWSRLLLLVSLASCILAVSEASAEAVARYRGGYSGYRRNYNYYRGYNSYHGLDHRHEVERTGRGGLRRKYGYKIVSTPARTGQRRRPTFSLDIDFPSEQKLSEISSNKIDVKEKAPFAPFVFPVPKKKKLPLIKSNPKFPTKSVNQRPAKPIGPSPKPAVPTPTIIPSPQPSVPSPVPSSPPSKPAVSFPGRIMPPSQPAAPALGLPPPQPAVPSPGPIIPPSQPAVPSPRPVIPPPQPAVPSRSLPPQQPAAPAVGLPPPQPAVPSLPEAVPAVPGRPVLSSSSSSRPSPVENTFVPMPVPAVPGL